MDKWDKRFLDLAEHISQWSKDPSTQVGAVIARGKNLDSVGFNGFPSSLLDQNLEDRDYKLARTVHGELNAIKFARSPEGSTLYTWPFGPCSTCAIHIINYGISRVVFPRNTNPRWEESINISKQLFIDAGIEIVEV